MDFSNSWSEEFLNKSPKNFQRNCRKSYEIVEESFKKILEDF